MKHKKISLDQIPEKLLPAEKLYDEGSEHPMPEQMLLREAVKHLTPKQREVWELYNYDKLSQREIAKRLNKRRSTIQTQIHQCEDRIVKWCKMNMATYKMIKQEMEKE